MLITLDEYYSIEEYNERIQALKNNGIEYKEYISIKSPYNWYIDIPSEPIMTNYDKLSNQDERWLINKVQALRPNEEYLFQRRNDSKGAGGVLKYTENKPLKEVRLSDYAVFFNARSKEQLEQITKSIPVKVYYFGKYYSNKYKVALCTNKMILNYIDRDQILLENKGNYNEPGRFEAEFNYKILKDGSKLHKFTETAYFENGSYHAVKIKGDRKTGVSQAL